MLLLTRTSPAAVRVVVPAIKCSINCYCFLELNRLFLMPYLITLFLRYLGQNQLSATINQTGNVVLTFVGIPGYNHTLEWTHNLLPPIAWIPIFTNSAATNGFLIYTNPPSGGVDFYRMRSVL